MDESANALVCSWWNERLWSKVDIFLSEQAYSEIPLAEGMTKGIPFKTLVDDANAVDIRFFRFSDLPRFAKQKTASN